MIETFNNNLGTDMGAALLNKFFKECREGSSERDARNYHVGLNSIFDCNDSNTVYENDVLVSAEGLSPRLLLFR